jgi:hypothetical protein
MAYKNLIENITLGVEYKFAEISTRYNFDNGDEFEIAMCELFRLILPIKYGVCRGFAVTKENSFAGDDIIIFDRERFPTLRLFEDKKYAKKQEIPIEAVYCYIEAKNKLVLDGSNSNFEKAICQVSEFKKLEREKRKLLSIDHHINFGEMFSVEKKCKWPSIANPMFTAIISRHVQNFNSDKKSNFKDFILEEINRLTIPEESPDLIIAGPNLSILPEILDDVSSQNDSPFVNKNNPLKVFDTPNMSFGIGIVTILYALDNIRLGQMPYSKIINNSIN